MPTLNVLRRPARLGALALCCLCLLLWPEPGLAQGGSTSLWQTYTVNDGLLSSNVSAVFLAQDGALWFGVENGVSRFRDGVWQSLTAKDGLPAGRVRTIQQTADGAIWFGGETGGLARRTADGVCCQTWTTAHGLASNDVRAILPDGDQAAWVGTAAGLMRLEAGRLTRVDALAGKPIWALARGADGVIWAATAGQGVWSRGRDGNWRGLESSPLVSGQVFALWAENGRLWAGTETVWPSTRTASGHASPCKRTIRASGCSRSWGMLKAASGWARRPVVSGMRASLVGLWRSCAHAPVWLAIMCAA